MKMRKNYGVIAAGGLGTRLKTFKDNIHTKVLIELNGLSMISTQINQLKSWGIDDFIVITNPEFDDLIRKDLYKNFQNENISFVIQNSPNGIADALSCTENLLEEDSIITFVLGDNFFGSNPINEINFEKFSGAHLFLKEVSNPEEFGVIEIDSNNKPVNLHEKPQKFISSLAVVGLYLYETSCFNNIRTLSPSNRGELEITDLNKIYLSEGEVDFSVLSSWWIDAGTEERINELRRLI